jgi:hypothetical protein
LQLSGLAFHPGGAVMRARRIPLSHGAHVTGWHPVRPGHGMVQFESALERDCICFLARHPGFLRIKSQPITISFEHAGHARRYTPDFLAYFESLPDVLVTLGLALQTYIEVKYAEQAAADRDLITARLDTLRRATGLPAVLLDERIIRGGSRT